MKMMAFGQRNRKELLRDPLSFLFGIGFPVVLLVLLSLMNRGLNGIAEQFEISAFAPGMAVFGLSFLSLFLGMLVAADRQQSFLMRLFASPLKARDYIGGYSLPLVPLALCQSVVCFGAALCFGLPLSWHLAGALVALVPVSLLFIGCGLLLGSLFTGNQVGGVGSILINVAAWLSGTWFPVALIGGVFETICYALPFAHAVDVVRLTLAGQWGAALPHLIWVLGYTVLIFALAAGIFRKKMKN